MGAARKKAMGRPVALSIAGSDLSGGAGIRSGLQTFLALALCARGLRRLGDHAEHASGAGGCDLVWQPGRSPVTTPTHERWRRWDKPAPSG